MTRADEMFGVFIELERGSQAAILGYGDRADTHIQTGSALLMDWIRRYDKDLFKAMRAQLTAIVAEREVAGNGSSSDGA